MARRSLITSTKRTGRFEPLRAPHAPLVRELLTGNLPALHRRLRAEHIDGLAARILMMERSPVPLVELPSSGQLGLLALRVVQVLQQLEVEERASTRAFAAFTQMLSRATDPDERRRVLTEYLEATASSPAQLRGDLRALDRFLGADALRERNARAELALSIQAELGLWWLESALRAIASHDDAELRGQIVRSGVGPLLATRMVEDRRWQVRWAAGRALVAATELDHGCGDAARAAIDETAQNRDEHPWVQAAALEASILLDPATARERLTARLLAPGPGRDAFLRKLALHIALVRLAPEVAASLVTELAAAADPSEHVRIAIAEACPKLDWSIAAPILAGLTGAGERGARVRAAGAYVLRAISRSAVPQVAAAASDLLCRIVDDAAPYPALVACDELAGLAADLGASDRDRLGELAPGWLAALARRIADPETAPQIAEHAAAAAEAIDRERDPVRRALTRVLAETTADIRPGRRATLDVGRLPPELSSAAGDERMLGRVLADLTRRDWGVSVSRRGHRIRIWRGDRFRRRLWRIVHELRNPLPNKRQAWVHTVGRTYPGTIRAHPGLLEEATATTVPGERVSVDSEGSWGRHLPTIDDLLDMPVLRRRDIRVVSSAGTVVVSPPGGVLRRARNWLQLTLRYRRLVMLRLASLRARRDPQRRRYLELLEASYGITARFEPHTHDTAAGSLAPIAADTADLFPVRPGPAVPSAPLGAALALPSLGSLRDWFESNRAYFASPTQNSQSALVLFAASLAAVFWARSWHKRQQIARARARIPLTIGGWGTRGKSGTERLKAGLLDGLGYEVFVKTTGCEAMFIHSAPLQQPVEIFIYRPYDKATIWEQMAMVVLGSRLGTDVFLWECMALNPKYVQLLQRDWMRDDLVTLTNCYPDHEDIQGPAGFNVANVITEFIPNRSVLVTSEMSYLPLFHDVCARRGTTMHTVGDREAELIGEDVLALFPYREHPRNIALVERIARELDIDRDLALLTMAENVVPDLGVLKAYPRCRVRGRVVEFLCGNSANERTGFIGNWRRMQLDQLDVEREPHRMVITVVNNRADRISRSEVFARILVRDIDCDRHVLIGTNLKGLRGFIDTALDDYLAEITVIEPTDLAKGEVPVVVASRFAREMAKLRVPRPTVEAALTRLALYARGAGLRVEPDHEPIMRDLLADRLGRTGSLAIDEVVRQLERDDELTRALDAALQPMPEPPDLGDLPETLEPATRDEVIDHARFELARLQIRARLEARLAAVFAAPSEEQRLTFGQDAGAAFRALFLAQVDIIDDPGASGDQIIDRCARCVPPGVDVILMGTQNIKGTGLDFVYRWLALDKVVTCVRDQASPRLDRRIAALTELEAFEDHGLVDTGFARALLSREPLHRPTTEEAEARARIAAKVEAVWIKRKAALVERKKSGWIERIGRWGEAWVDWIDSARRGRQAAQIVDDLVEQRISHQRAAVEMRSIVGRIKGGWLVKALRRRRQAR